VVDRVDVGEYRHVTENGRLLTGDYIAREVFNIIARRHKQLNQAQIAA
jgi:hypothetical protein